MPKYVDASGLAHFWDKLKPQFGAESNPVYYGADPTGESDSSSAIEECIEANKGSSIWFTQGTYRISRPIKTPHLYTDRVSIDFNGAKIVSSDELDCFLDIGGFDPQDSGPAGRIRTFYRNGTFQNIGSTETSGLTKTGIKIKKYYKNAVIQNCNVLYFMHGIEVCESTGESSDTQISECLLLWMDVADWAYKNEESYVPSAGITYNGADNKVSNCHIIGFHYTFVINSGGTYIDNVHNYPKGITAPSGESDPVAWHANRLRGTAFLLANAGAIITRCYCDTYETFVAINANGIRINMDNCFQYASLTSMNMAFIRYLYEGNSTASVRITNSTADIRPAADSGVTNRAIVFNSLDNNAQTLQRLYLQNNHLVGFENVVAGDLFATQGRNVNNYWANNNWPRDTWMPIAIMVLPNVSRCGYVDFTIDHYINGGGVYSARIAGLMTANTSNKTIDMSRVQKITDAFVYSIGYNYTYDNEHNVYYLVFYMMGTTGNATTNYSCVNNNDFNHFVSPYSGDGYHSPDANITSLVNVDVNNVTQLS